MIKLLLVAASVLATDQYPCRERLFCGRFRAAQVTRLKANSTETIDYEVVGGSVAMKKETVHCELKQMKSASLLEARVAVEFRLYENGALRYTTAVG